MNEVEEVLLQAKDALERHRDWMARRRVQRIIVPSNIPASLVRTDNLSDFKRAQWAVSSSDYKDAPPPFIAASSKKRTRIRSNQIIPSVETSEDSVETKESLSTVLKPIFVAPQVDDEKGNDGECTNAENFPKKLVLSELSVSKGGTPLWQSKDQLSNGHGGGLLDVEISDEEGYQHEAEVKTESGSPPPYKMSTSAWGEQKVTLLENHMIERDPHAALKSTSIDRVVNSIPAQQHSISTSSHMYTSCSSPTSVSPPPAATSESLPPRHQSIEVSMSPSPLNGKNTSSIRNDKDEESEGNDDSYSKLQQSSSARIVAVSPAPREQTTTFSAHTKSKIGSADDTTSYNYSLLARNTDEASRSEVYPAPWSGFHGGNASRASKGGEVPGANVQMVLPAEGELDLHVRVADQRGTHEPETPTGQSSDQNERRSPENCSNLKSTTSEFSSRTSVPETRSEGDLTVVDLNTISDSIGRSRPNKDTVANVVSRNPATVSDGRFRLPAIVNDPIIVAPKKMEDGSVAKTRKKKKNKQRLVGTAVNTNENSGHESLRKGLVSLDEQSSGSHSALHEKSSGVHIKAGDLQGPLQAHDDEEQAAVITKIESPGTSSSSLMIKDEVQHSNSCVDGNQLVKELPPLKITSLLPALLAGMNIHPKRSRGPPGYDIHQPKSGLVLSPPCPLFGAEQPKERETLAHISQQFNGAKSNGNGQPGHSLSEQQQNRPVWSRSKSMGAGSSGRLGRSSSTLVLNGELSEDDKPLERATSARNLSELNHAPHASTLRDFVPGPGPLHIAAKLGNLRRVQALLDQGHDVDLPDEAGRTPLMYCIKSDGVHLSCADALIQYGANLDKQTSDGATAVHMAASAGALSILELLLLNHAQPDVQDFEGRRPIHWATLQSNTKVFSLLLNRCGPVSGGLESTDDAGMTVLMWAAYHNNHRIVSYLMDQGADTEEKDKEGYTAMHWAIHKEGSRSLQLLLQPDMTYFKDHLGKTLMHVAAEKGSMSACEVVLKLRPDAIHDRDKMGRTPLHYGAACSRVDVCALLLDYGADASQKDALFKTALDYAREKRLDYVVALLSCHGNAVADFARSSRSVSVSSLFNRSFSFSQLPTMRDENSEDDVKSTTSSMTMSNQVSSSQLPRQSPDSNVVSSGYGTTVDPAKGGYLGWFFPNDKDLVKHYFFRLNEQEGSISWSRSREDISGTSSKALVLEVHREPSNTVREISSFSPADLHCFTFWVGTSGGVLDLLAYNEDAYNVWLLELERVAGRNSNLSRSAIQQFKGTSVHSRPISSHSSTRKSSRIAATPRRAIYDRMPADQNQNIDTAVFIGSQSSTHTVSMEDNTNKIPQKAQYRSKRITPLEGSSDDLPPVSSRNSELNFMGEKYQTSYQPTAVQVDSDIQGTVI